jgi:hypothetical protein
LFRSGGGFFVAPSSFGCFVEGRTRVYLFRKGVDVLLGNTLKPQAGPAKLRFRFEVAFFACSAPTDALRASAHPTMEQAESDPDFD